MIYVISENSVEAFDQLRYGLWYDSREEAVAGLEEIANTFGNSIDLDIWEFTARNTGKT